MSDELIRKSKLLAGQLTTLLQQVSAIQVPVELHDLLSTDLERIRAILRDRIYSLDPAADV